MKIVEILVAGAASLALAAAPARADEKNEERPRQHVTMDELPSGVQLTVQREAKGKSIAWMATEQEDGKTVYEVEVVSNGKGEVLEISETGKVLDREPAHEEKGEADHGEK